MTILGRPIPNDLSVEPYFPDHDGELVILSIRYPDLCCHQQTDRCHIQTPHLAEECAEFNFSDEVDH